MPKNVVEGCLNMNYLRFSMTQKILSESTLSMILKLPEIMLKRIQKPEMPFEMIHVVSMRMMKFLRFCPIPIRVIR